MTQDATGDVLVAGVGPSGTEDALLRSDDGGASWRAAATLPGYFLETVEVAPSDPSRVYATAFVTGPEPVFLRSDDGGATMRETTRSFAGAQSAWIAGVDPTRPDVVYVRGQRPGGAGTILSRSDDGGRSFRRLAETTGAMRGFALSDDGATVWFGSSDAREGLQRSVRGGPFARTREQPVVQCLRQHAGTLYVCADEAVDGYALGRSRDGGDTVTPLLSLRALTDPVTCPAGGGASSATAAPPSGRRSARRSSASTRGHHRRDRRTAQPMVRWRTMRPPSARRPTGRPPPPASGADGLRVRGARGRGGARVGAVAPRGAHRCCRAPTQVVKVARVTVYARRVHWPDVRARPRADARAQSVWASAPTWDWAVRR